MKKRKATARKNSKSRAEGTLEQFVFASESGDDFDEATAVASAVSIVGLPDFIAKARDLAQRMAGASGSIRAERAESLRRDLDRLQTAVQRGVDQAALYDAVGAALTFANLRHEEIDDSKSRGKITRREYLKLKAQGLRDKQIAAALRVTSSKLSEWKRRHLSK